MIQRILEDAAILIVDDEVSLRNTFEIFLSREGCSLVKTAGSFDDAVRAVSDQLFDLIFCDIVLENRSGIDLLKRFRELGITCPVVIITGYPHVDTASEAVRLGAFDYLKKPVEKEILLQIAKHAVQQYRLEIAAREAERRSEAYQHLLEAIFRSVSDPILSVDRELNISNMNGAAEEFFDRIFPGQEPIINIEYLASVDAFFTLPVKVRQVMETGREVTDFRLEYNRRGKDFSLLSICISALHNDHRGDRGCVIVIREMSRPKTGRCEKRRQFHRMIGACPAMQKVYMMIESIGKVDTSVLITGASGTGKELVAEALHLESGRRDKPFVSVNCTALSDDLKESELFGHRKGAFTGAEGNRQGRFFQANGGTLFLDEIGDISMPMQLQLLRFLQEKTFYPVGGDKEVHVDVRVIAATNADLRRKVAEGIFREDLYYRLLIIDINLPPLCERDGDIGLLANSFLRNFSTRMGKNITGISEQAIEKLCSYDWPGNVRQLEHVIERATVLCEGVTISSMHLPDEILGFEPATSIKDVVPRPEMTPARSSIIPSGLSEEEQNFAAMILDALRKTGGNKAKAARRLKIDRSTLYRKIQELNIDISTFYD